MTGRKNLPLVSPGGDSSLYSGESLFEKISQLKNSIASGNLLEAFKDIPQCNNVETQSIGALGNNSSRNRYSDILPYDSTRVVLQNEMNDYINASHIRLALTNQNLEDAIQDNQSTIDNKSWFIAAQNPLEDTTANFWTMAWQQRVKTIVVMSNPSESENKTQVLFWPNETGECVKYGEHKVQTTCSHQLKSFHVFKLQLHSFLIGSSRNLTLLFYSDWKFDSAIASRDSVDLEPTSSSTHEFIRFCNYVLINNQDTSPFLVTCEDAIGRTGVFIALVQVVKSIEKGKEFQLERIVRQMREWRPNMLHEQVCPALGHIMSLWLSVHSSFCNHSKIEQGNNTD
ncbi:tyrosine-protein phosphatase non-receptor type 3-like [Convolutriloba macropyga]|uniref:tyrosine-protein phosphatase non-receptor type 3-like n=1 Tax=Convolutriloba macropyga TaxID=536237 RepID=UPI003F51C66B